MSGSTAAGQSVESRLAGMIVRETPHSLSLCHTWTSTIGVAIVLSMLLLPFVVASWVCGYVLSHFEEGAINGKPYHLASAAERFWAWLMVVAISCILWAGTTAVVFHISRGIVHGRTWLVLNRRENQVAWGRKVVGRLSDVAKIRLTVSRDDEGEDAFSLFMDAANGQWPPVQVQGLGTGAEMVSLGRRLAEYCQVPFCR